MSTPLPQRGPFFGEEPAHTSGIILLKVIEYLAFKVQYADVGRNDIREDFQTKIDPYIALEL